MATEVLKNKRGVTIGTITDSSSNKLVIKNRNGVTLGYYDKIANTTKDRSGKLIGRGNLLVSLIDFNY